MCQIMTDSQCRGGALRRRYDDLLERLVRDVARREDSRKGSHLHSVDDDFFLIAEHFKNLRFEMNGQIFHWFEFF